MRKEIKELQAKCETNIERIGDCWADRSRMFRDLHMALSLLRKASYLRHDANRKLMVNNAKFWLAAAELWRADAKNSLRSAT